MPKHIEGDLPYVLYENGKLYVGQEEIIPEYGGEYPYWRLSMQGSWVRYPCHRLMAESFKPNPLRLPVVNHIDGNKYNWHLENLEWITQRENVIHAHHSGLVRRTTNVDKVNEICEMILEGCTNAEIAKVMGITQGAVCNIRSGRRHRSISCHYW